MDPRVKHAIACVMDQMPYSPEAVTWEQIPADGSTRQFWRGIPPGPDPPVVLMVNPPHDAAAQQENRAYLKIGRHLKNKSIAVPEIYECDLETGWFLMADLGRQRLQDAIAVAADPVSLYEAVLDQLVRLQIRGAEGFDPSWCCQTARYDDTVMRQYESAYFRDAFLHHYLGGKPSWPELEEGFAYLAHRASTGGRDVFLHRDFQSKNILISDLSVGIVDWQGGRLGPLGYDLAALLIDPYAGLTRSEQETLYHRYVERISGMNADWLKPLHATYPYLAIQRNLQILGAFAYLTTVINKPQFESYIPAAVTSLYHLLNQVDDPALLPLRGLTENILKRYDDPHVRDRQGW